MLPINEIICGRNESVLATFPAECIDLTVTSPPYDNLRTYKGFEWDFTATAEQLYRVTKIGGVVVWVVADATINGSETGTSFRQALGFMDIGFCLNDTMIYQKDNPMPGDQPRYCQGFEYMFVFSKGKPSTFNVLTGISTNAGKSKIGQTQRNVDGSLKLHTGNGGIYKETKKLSNVWGYSAGFGHSTVDNYAFEHHAMFPEKLVEDHILSWSNPGDVVLDPFVGSGTTPKMAIRHHRNFIGIDISAEYCELTRKRIGCVQQSLFGMAS